MAAHTAFSPKEMGVSDVDSLVAPAVPPTAERSGPALVRALSTCRSGELVEVISVDHGEASVMALRMGLVAGEVITVLNRQLGGPMVIRQANAELALGQNLCRAIQVKSKL
jgi:Fe2+ transport system protein FeoA